MDSVRWTRIEAVCAGALDRPADERATWIATECAGDEALAREVRSLLEQLDSEPDFLERAVIARVPADETFPAGTALGAFRVARSIGRGGMGEVYLAHRDVDGVAQPVALKVIRRGMATDDVLERFRLERRILASLHHPNVAQLVDAGATPDGRPYVAMEYVDGVPLTDYCDQRALSVTDRLRLFRVICAAVQHAHQRLVVHRDLKPRNILVEADGTPKLLDFGIGKVIGEDTALGAIETRADVRLLTPEYAAPEQVNGGVVTTATDVYALGVILHELLTGQRPRAQALRSEGGTEGSTPRPSTTLATLGPGDPAARARATTPEQLRRRLAGDLDTIVLMALRPEPERRYPSAAALDDDIRRHLEGLPVSARPDTLGYRVRTFVRRNPAGVATTAAFAAALVVIAVVSMVQSRRVQQEAARTAAERDKALEVRSFLMEMFGATGADQAVGDTVSVRALLDRQREQLDRAYAGRDPVRADMLEVLADGYDRLGLYADAEPLAAQALALRRRLLPADHPDVATSLNLLGWIQHERGQSVAAEPLLLEAARIRRGRDERSVDGYSRSLNDLGVVYNAIQRYPDAERVLSEALEIRRRVFGDQHRTVGITANNLAAAFYYQRKLDDAVSTQALALRSLQASVGEDHQRTVVALSNLAAFKRAGGDLAGAEADYRQLLARQAGRQGRDHPVAARVVFSLAAVVEDRGVLEKSDTLLAEAEALYREALGSLEQRLGSRHPQVGSAMDRLGGVLTLRGRPREAIPLQARALAMLRATTSDTSRIVQQRAERLAASHRAAGDSAGASVVLRSITRSVGPRVPPPG